MSTNLLIKGFIIGFSIAAPVGPIGILCIRRTLANGRLSGFISGLGAATVDGLYGAIAAFGLTFISNILVGQQQWFRLGGGLFLLYLGSKIFLAKPAENIIREERRNLVRDYISTFFLTLVNPTTILSFTAIFAGLGMESAATDYISAVNLVLGIVLGSISWWFILSSGVSALRSKFNYFTLQWVNRISGSIIGIFGVIVLLSFIVPYLS